MDQSIGLLLVTAASLGFIHTIIGPDHYIPFVAMSRAGNWSTTKTLVITFLCGLGHIGSSIALGFIGIALGLAVGKLQAVESVRGNIAAWFLIAFGLVYAVWGLRRAYRRHSGHSHLLNSHDHHSGHEPHSHQGANLTPWVLFTIFIFGPCEPLIPLVMYPAARHNIAGVALVAAVFGVVTIATMLSVVLALRAGVSLIPFERLERFNHALAGGAILACGCAIQLFRL